jgi:putative integral membrane protein (TIGR02587 family)
VPQRANRTESTFNDSHDNDPYGWRQESRDLLRGLAGGAIVGMPLLYTMEMWWHGMTLGEWHLLVLLGVILLINFLFSLVSGFRQEYSVAEALSESITAVGLGIVFSFVVLCLIGELTWDAAPDEIVAKILLEALVVSVGVSFANAQVLGKSRTGDDNQQGHVPNADDAESGTTGKPDERGDEPADPERLQLRADLKDAGATLAGAIVFALNIAPTEEVLMIATRLGPWQQLAMLAGGMLLCYIILFASGFEEHQVYVESIFQNPLAETIMTSALSLAVSFALLLLFGQREVMSYPVTAIAATITLGLPAIVGGAAGRLII